MIALILSELARIERGLDHLNTADQEAVDRALHRALDAVASAVCIVEAAEAATQIRRRTHYGYED
jgi:hypothetical protein